jgi:hypothetical protein
MKAAVTCLILALFGIVMAAGYYDTTRHDFLLPKDGWVCVATFKSDGTCAAYASKRLIAIGQGQDKDVGKGPMV